MSWRHKKSGDKYYIIGFTIHSETLELMVNYERYDSVEVKWTRPASMFFDGRFIPIGDDGKDIEVKNPNMVKMHVEYTEEPRFAYNPPLTRPATYIK